MNKEFANWRVIVAGRVQGVGFRPFVARLARELGLRGFVRNCAAGVEVVVGGERIEQFLMRLKKEAPLAARIDGVQIEKCKREIENREFDIAEDSEEGGRLSLAPDQAVCHACLTEMFDPQGRRWRYPFVTCTECGPRLSVATGIPFARRRTTMSRFRLCVECTREFEDPADRRFHAELISCPACGPRLLFLDKKGKTAAGDPLETAWSVLASGGVVAMKGLGGFQLVCVATAREAVARLRAGKRRPAKPLAVMALNRESLPNWVAVDEESLSWWESAEAPIVLFPRRDKGTLELIAPELGWLGVMRPTTPLHYLLWHEAHGRPEGTKWLQEPSRWLLVVTSANRSGEPMVVTEQEALAQLSDVVDGFLVHDREIAQRLDDSVGRVVGKSRLLIRRARGFAPEPVAELESAAGIAFGDDGKGAVALATGKLLFITPYLGELSKPKSFRSAAEIVARWCHWLGLSPQWVACDAHPNAWARRLAEEWQKQTGATLLPVQHHAAHLGVLMAEGGGEVKELVGWAVDGFGWGEDGSAWGGELLRLCESGSWMRLEHLPALPLPGGDAAAHWPWRMGIAALWWAGASTSEVKEWWLQRQRNQKGEEWPSWPAVEHVWNGLRKGVFRLTTTAAGRWFDAVAALLGVSGVNRFEGEAAMRLEGTGIALTEKKEREKKITELLEEGDWKKAVRILAKSEEVKEAAWEFHLGLARFLAKKMLFHRKEKEAVGVAGGCAQNDCLVTLLNEEIGKKGVGPLRLCKRVPANDGGLAVGQAWLASRQFVAGITERSPTWVGSGVGNG